MELNGNSGALSWQPSWFRLAPTQLIGLLQAFLAMELSLTMEWEVYEQACRLAVNLNHHFFDTLYHAVALQLLMPSSSQLTPNIFEKQLGLAKSLN